VPDNDKIRDSSTVSNPPLSNVLFEALGKIIFDREKIVFGGFNIGCPASPAGGGGEQKWGITIGFNEIDTHITKTVK